MNPLSANDFFPAFSQITPTALNEALKASLAHAQAEQERIAALGEAPSWANTVSALDEATEPLFLQWLIANHLQGLVDTEALRDCVNEWLEPISNFGTQLAQDLRLYEKYKAIRANAASAGLSAEQIKVLDNNLRDFKLSGAELNAENRAAFAALQSEKAQAQQSFSENLLDATKAFSHLITDPTELAGLPEDELAARAAAAKAQGKEGYLLTLHMPAYLPVMQYCSNRSLRETLYRAYATRASELGDAKLDNTPLMRKIVQLRAKQAALLGFKDYTEVSLAAKMASSSREVNDFLYDLATKAKPAAQKDLSELKAFAAEKLGIADLQAWDLAFVSEALKTERYAYSENEVKQYLTEPKVFAGLFGLIEKLFGVRFEAASADVWHDSVRFFKMMRGGVEAGYLYVDPYAREGKRGGAWMQSLRSHAVKNAAVQLPIAFVVCNAAPPVGDKPALLTMDQVTTLFHEFGHALHHLLSTVKETAISGIDGVEWDAVELPSQFMENFCWDKNTFLAMTAHWQSGAAMPEALFQKMLAAKNFQSGLGTLRQIEFSLFDMQLHAAGKADEPIDELAILQAVRKEVAVLPPPEFNRFAQSFGHIYAGGYAAGYYSYKWAEVLSADAFAAFEESGEVVNATVGERFQREVLSLGGSRSAMDNFIAFRGRKPTIDALLRHNGL